MHKSIWLLCSMAMAGMANPEPLSLEKALDLARIYSPALRAARLQTEAAHLAVSATGRWNNPELEFEAEGVGGDLDGFGEAEYTLGLSQTFIRGDKRNSAKAVAQKGAGIAFQKEAEIEQALLAEVRLAFIDLFALQEIGKVRADQEQLGRAFFDVANKRYKAGAGSELEVVEAELAMEEIRLAQTCSLGDLEAARKDLAGLIGLPEDQIGELSGAYDQLNPVEGPLLSSQHPSIQRQQAEIDQVKALAVQAKAQDATDFTLGAGYKYEAAEEVNTFVIGASVPLNFVRAGRAQQATYLVQADAMVAEQQELKRAMQQQLSVLVSRYDSAKREAEITRDRLIPKAEKAYALCTAGYAVGRYSWLELIAAQQHLAEIRVRYIESLQSAHQFRAAISRFMKEGM